MFTARGEARNLQMGAQISVNNYEYFLLEAFGENNCSIVNRFCMRSEVFRENELKNL